MAKEMGKQEMGRVPAVKEDELKVCELCGWLNLEANSECFVCGWHGRFERDPEVVRIAIEQASRRYGRLELQHVTDLRTYREPAPPTFRFRLQSLLRRLFSRFGR